MNARASRSSVRDAVRSRRSLAANPTPRLSRRDRLRARWGSDPVHRRRRRLVGLMVIFALGFAGPIYKLVRVQVLQSENYVSFGRVQRERSVSLAAARGSIVDRNGLALAVSEPRPTIWSDPANVTDPAGAASSVGPLLGMDEANLRDLLTSTGHFVPLAEDVDERVAEKIEELAIPGVYRRDEPKRVRPAGDLAESVIGKVVTGTAVAGNQGSTGIELLHDDVLTGTPGEVQFERSIDGRRIPAGEQWVEPATPGADLVLTLHRGIQHRAEQALAAQVAETGADGGWMVVGDPRTGELLAIANVEKRDGEVRNVGHNKALTANYDPGSVLKVVTMAAALRAGEVGPNSWLDVPARLQIADKEFSDPYRWETEPMTVTDILAESSNVGSIMVATRVGRAELHRTLTDFGLGSKPGIDFPGEAAGRLNPIDRWSGTDIGSVAIGQGIATTGHQLLGVYGAIANGGTLTQPTLVRTTIGPDGERTLPPAPLTSEVLSESVSRDLTNMMVEVVERGTGTRAAIPGYSVAGKTGTAWKFFERTGYLDGGGNRQYISSFAGFAPAENPRLVAVVSIDQPDPEHPEGGVVAGPVFADVIGYGLRALRVEPSVTPEQGDGPVRAEMVLDPNAEDADVNGVSDAPVTDSPVITEDDRTDRGAVDAGTEDGDG